VRGRQDDGEPAVRPSTHPAKTPPSQRGGGRDLGDVRSGMECCLGRRLYLVTAVGDRYAVRVADDGSVIGLWRRP